MKTFNEFDSALRFTVTFSHPAYYSGQFTKEVFAPSINEAIELAGNSDYYPAEFPDYDRMDIVIDDSITGKSIYYNELPNE